MNIYLYALNKIVENSCPRKTNCQSCGIPNTCNCLMKDEVDTLQELVDRATPKKPNHISIIKGLLGKYVCPICGHQIHFKQGDNEPNEMGKYCSKCGQAIEGVMNNECTRNV